MKFVRRTQIIWSALLQFYMYTDRHIHTHRFHAQIDHLVPNKCHVLCTPSHHVSETSVLSSFLLGWYFHYDTGSSASQPGMENMYCAQKMSMCIYINFTSHWCVVALRNGARNISTMQQQYREIIKSRDAEWDAPVETEANIPAERACQECEGEELGGHSPALAIRAWLQDVIKKHCFWQCWNAQSCTGEAAD